MGKYETYHRTPPKSGRQLGIHPAWYIAGIFFMLLVPLLSFGIAELLFQYPEQLPQVSRLLYNATDLYVKPAQLAVIHDKYFYIKLIVAACVSAVFYALFALVTFFVNSMFGAARYGPYDVPPMQKPRGTRIRKAR